MRCIRIDHISVYVNEEAAPIFSRLSTTFQVHAIHEFEFSHEISECFEYLNGFLKFFPNIYWYSIHKLDVI